VTTFIPGIELSRSFFADAVKPLIETSLPDLRYGAALLGSGSEVLGFDTPMSADHNWGPRVDLFLRQTDVDTYRQTLDDVFRTGLPRVFRGYPTSFTDADPNDNNTRLPEQRDSGPVRHQIAILSSEQFVRDYLGFDSMLDITPADWLTFPEQKLGTLACGPIFHDDPR
jgi:hypothetical protein